MSETINDNKNGKTNINSTDFPKCESWKDIIISAKIYAHKVSNKFTARALYDVLMRLGKIKNPKINASAIGIHLGRSKLFKSKRVSLASGRKLTFFTMNWQLTLIQTWHIKIILMSLVIRAFALFPLKIGDNLYHPMKILN